MVGVGYTGDDCKSKTGVTDVESCQTFCTEDPATPYFGWWESKAQCWCKTKEDPAKRVELTGGYVSGPVSCVMPPGKVQRHERSHMKVLVGNLLPV